MALREFSTAVFRLKRKIDNKLTSFFKDEHIALLVTGARQVGKTFSIRAFGKAHFKSFVEINFIKEPEAQKIFRDVADEKDVLVRLSAYIGNRLVPRETLVFLDEIQECPEAVTYIKFLVEDGQYRYVCSGSLLGVELKDVRSYPVGFMSELEMFPLDFEEFLVGVQFNAETLNLLRENVERQTAIDSFIHDRLLRLFRLYLVVGGMPAAVAAYVKTNNLRTVLDEQRSILATYRRDIVKYDKNNALRIRDVYARLPSELASENKRFKFGSVSRGSHFDRLEDGFLWLKAAGVAILSYCVEEPREPLRLSEKRNLFKLFANDVGLLSAMYADGIQLKILNGEKSLNIGAVYENAVAQELTAHGIIPNYFHSKKQGELDFVISTNEKVHPIEVKSGKDYKRHSALDNVLSNSDYDIEKAYVLSNGNIEQNDKVIYLPVYAAMFLRTGSIPAELIYPPPQ